MSEVKDMFEGKRHPECLSGEKSAEQCKVEFLNLFKAHNNASTGFQNETSISLLDFLQYHQILSTFYLRDTEFKNFLIGVWNMDLKPVDEDFAGKKPEIQGKNSREQWKMENYQSLYGNRLLDDGIGGNKIGEYQKQPLQPAGTPS